MDRRRPHGAEDATDPSDDLISELARLMGQEARSAAASEPVVAPVLAERRESGPTSPLPRDPERRIEPDFGPGGARVSAGATIDDLEFDFGLAPRPPVTPQPEPVPQSPAPEPQVSPDADPIAALIADAEEEAHTREVASWNDGEQAAERFDDAPAPAPEVEQASQGSVLTPNGADVTRRPEEGAAAENTPRDRDPLSDIEALIGEAARADIEPGPMGARRVRSIYASGPAPAARIEPGVEDDGMSAAERAILAAAAASGAQKAAAEPELAAPARPVAEARSDTPPAEEAYDTYASPDDVDEDFVQPASRFRRRGRGGILLPAALGTVLLVALVGGYVVLFGDRGADGEAPVLLADGEPVRAIPEPTNTTGTTAESVVFSDIEGQAANAEDSTLVSRDETEGAAGPAVSNFLASGESGAEPVNRTVRTVTVRPDGTIVSGDQLEAGATILPVDRPQVPEVPGSVAASDPIADAITAALAEDLAPADSETTDIALAGPEAGAADETRAPEGMVDVPLPLPRPPDLPVIPAAAAAPATSQGAAPAASGPVGAWVQLASQRTEADARGGIPELQNRYGSLFGGAQLEVSSVDLGAQGVYYRVRLPQPSIAQANSVCGAILAQGGDCFVVPN